MLVERLVSQGYRYERMKKSFMTGIKISLQNIKGQSWT